MAGKLQKELYYLVFFIQKFLLVFQDKVAKIIFFHNNEGKILLPFYKLKNKYLRW